MKILHLVPTYLPAHRYGGPIASVHAMNKSLVAAGVDVTVFTTNTDGAGTLDVPLGSSVLIDGVKVFYFPITFRPWSYSRAMHQALREHANDFSLLHVTSVFLAVSTLARHYARNSVPFVISPRGMLMKTPMSYRSLKKRWYLRRIERANLRDATAIHFTSDAEEDEFRSTGVQIRRSFVIPNSVDFAPLDVPVVRGAFRRAHGLSPRNRIVLFMGRLHWIKGLADLISAFRTVAQHAPDAALVLAGGDDAGYASQLQSLIASAELERRVHVVGRLDGNAKLEAFADADVFVLPSHSENFGMAAAEAMYLRLPTIVTHGVAISRWVNHRVSGMVVERASDPLADAMLELLGNPDLRSSMGQAGRMLIENHFSPSLVAKRFLAEYERACGLGN